MATFVGGEWKHDHMATIYSTATSLDGFIADDAESLTWLFNTPNSDADPQGHYGDDDTLGYDRFIQRVGATVMGANTLEWLKRESEGSDQPFTWPYEQPSWVITHRTVDLPDGVQRFEGNIAELHAQLVAAAGDKDVWIIGGGDLAGQFADEGLLDYVWVHLTPVTLGSGKPLLPRRLRLRREKIERDGQLTAMLFKVEGPEPV